MRAPSRPVQSPSLRGLCLRNLRSTHTDSLRDLGDTPDALVAEILAGATAAQLACVEDATLEGTGRSLRVVTDLLWRAHALTAGAADGAALPEKGWRCAYEAAVAREASRAADFKQRLRATYAAHEQLKQNKRIKVCEAPSKDKKVARRTVVAGGSTCVAPPALAGAHARLAAQCGFSARELLRPEAAAAAARAAAAPRPVIVIAPPRRRAGRDLGPHWRAAPLTMPRRQLDVGAAAAPALPKLRTTADGLRPSKAAAVTQAAPVHQQQQRALAVAPAARAQAQPKQLTRTLTPVDIF